MQDGSAIKQPSPIDKQPVSIILMINIVFKSKLQWKEKNTIQNKMIRNFLGSIKGLKWASTAVQEVDQITITLDFETNWLQADNNLIINKYSILKEKLLI